MDRHNLFREHPLRSTAKEQIIALEDIINDPWLQQLAPYSRILKWPPESKQKSTEFKLYIQLQFQLGDKVCAKRHSMALTVMSFS